MNVWNLQEMPNAEMSLHWSSRNKQEEGDSLTSIMLAVKEDPKATCVG